MYLWTSSIENQFKNDIQDNQGYASFQKTFQCKIGISPTKHLFQAIITNVHPLVESCIAQIPQDSKQCLCDFFLLHLLKLQLVLPNRIYSFIERPNQTSLFIFCVAVATLKQFYINYLTRITSSVPCFIRVVCLLSKMPAKNITKY